MHSQTVAHSCQRGAGNARKAAHFARVAKQRAVSSGRRFCATPALVVTLAEVSLSWRGGEA